MALASTIYIIAAASGTGKTSLVRALLVALPDLKLSVSHTTRAPRSDEQRGVDYYFISELEFRRMIEQDAFLEYADVFGDYKGTSRMEVERLSKMKVDIILEIDIQGARQVRALIPDTVSIFILPPSREALEQRIFKRGEDTPGDIEKRLKVAREEIACFEEYDYLVVNDDFDQALNELKAIIQARRCRQSVQSIKYKALLTELIA
jgi:guanylate kinase